MTADPTVPRWKKVRNRTLYGLFIGIIALGAVGFAWISRSRTMRVMAESFLFHAHQPKDVFSKPELNLLILGCDEDYKPNARIYGREVTNGAARSDMIMVAKLDFVHKRITGLSIPRDTRIGIPVKGIPGTSHKINAYFKYGKDRDESIALSKAAVESILPVTIDRVVVIDYQAFKELVDAVGGVKVNVDKDLIYDDEAGGLHINIKKGPQKLSGEQAIGFVRYRHAKVPQPDDDDFHRQQRQRAFLLSLKQAMLSDLIHLPEHVNKAVLVLGGALGEEEVGSLAMFGRDVKQADIKLGSIPTKDGRGSFLEVDTRALAKTLGEYNFSVPTAESGTGRG